MPFLCGLFWVLVFFGSQGGYHKSQAAERLFQPLQIPHMDKKLSHLINRKTCIIYILHTQTLVSYYQHLVSFTDLRLSIKNQSFIHNVTFEKYTMVTWTRSISTQQKTQVTAGLYSGCASSHLKTYQRKLKNIPPPFADLSSLHRQQDWLGDLTRLFHLLLLCWQAHKRSVFEEEFQWRWGNVMPNNNNITRINTIMTRINKLMKTKDTWEIGQSLPLQRKLTFLLFEHLVGNTWNRNVLALYIFQTTKYNFDIILPLKKNH